MLLVAIMLFAAFTAGGWMYAQKYKKPWRFFKELKELLLFIKGKVSFRKLSIVDVLDEYVSMKKNSCEWIYLLKDDFNNFFKNRKTEKEIMKNGIKIAESKEIVSFFQNFGGLDCVRQIEEIEQFICQISLYLDEYERLMKTMYPLVIKIAVFIGLMVAIVVV